MLVTSVLLAALCSQSPASAQRVINREPAIKAAYLYNFARYVTWPEESFPAEAEPLVIGVMGIDPVTDYLEQMAREGKQIAGHRLAVRRCQTLEDCVDCHILFVGKSSSEEQAREIVQKLDKEGLLLVGQTPGFVQDGGMINFFIAGNKVRFEINPDIAKQHNLKISSRLLAVAKVVRSAHAER